MTINKTTQTNVNKTRFIGKHFESGLDVALFVEDVEWLHELDEIEQFKIPKRTLVHLYDGTEFILSFSNGCALFGLLK